MCKITTEQVRAFVASKQESDLPDEVLKVFKAQAGKPFSKRILDKLPGGAERWTITQVTNMTNLEEYDRRSRGNRGISLLVAYAVKNIVIDPVFLEEKNPGYFSARRERNRKRVEVMNDIVKIRDMAATMNQVIDAHKALEAALVGLDNLISYGKDFSPDQYDWEKIVEGKMTIEGRKEGVK
jgi:hypothetical protein